MTLQTRKLTYEEYLEGPEIKARFDIVDGVMITAPTPTLEHQRILGKLFLLVDQFVSERQLGEVFFAPLDVIIQREPLRTRQPDLLFVSNDRAGIMEEYIQGPPNLVAEILSPRNTRRDVDDKLSDYGRLGVEECWLVSPEARTVEVLRLDQQSLKRTSIHGLGDHVQSEVISGLSLAVGDLFA
jgi:Uma2 family endonuclease